MMLKLAAAAAALLLAGPAIAETQPPCAAYTALVAALDQDYHEAPVARMLSDEGMVIEILASADGSTFTALLVQANGVACILSVGSDFSFVTTAGTTKPGSNS